MKNIHPFPARMAPDLALDQLKSLNADSIVLDPMTGSGTVLRQAVLLGHQAVGFDLDPLAVLMSQVWTTQVDTKDILKKAEEVLQEAWLIPDNTLRVEWIDSCSETQKFVDFWFLEPQQKDLRRLAISIDKYVQLYGDDPFVRLFKLSLSKLIITKKKGASVAWDVSHSRPHRKKETNDFNVKIEIKKSLEMICKRMDDNPILGKSSIQIGDARRIHGVKADAIVTSPPYLNAIDYMRGHKLALVWLGYSLPYLRNVRGTAVGAEKGHTHSIEDDSLHGQALKNCFVPGELSPTTQRMIRRYICDSADLMKSMRGALKTNGKLVLVIGDSCLKGTVVPNADYFSITGEMQGLKLIERSDRDLPGKSRYLPVPADLTNSLARRMTKETILTFIAT